MQIMLVIGLSSRRWGFRCLAPRARRLMGVFHSACVRLGQQIRGLAPHCLGYAKKIQEGDIAFAPLDFPHMGAVNPRVIGQGLLGPRQCLPATTDHLSESQKIAVLVLLPRHSSHGGIVAGSPLNSHGIYDSPLSQRKWAKRELLERNVCQARATAWHGI